ncbi:sensor domain-containing diguanylate cyclase [Agarivorans sp.]|uniref:sensor domain-containing diguanylate cyclase n=1 Tax=Agarivorans sp. TaxID=1872412 RepID=UPI003D009EC2
MTKVADISANYGVVIHRNFVPLYADDAYAQLFGYSRAEQIMALPSLLPLFSEADRVRAVEDYQALVSGSARPKARVFNNLKCSGEIFSALCIDHLIDWQGEPALQVTLVDFSQQIATEQRLRESEQRYRSLLESSLQGIVVHHNFIPLYCNQAMAELLAYDSAEQLMALPSLLALVPHELQPQVMQQHERLLKGEKVERSLVTEYVRRDGSSAWLHISEALVSWGEQQAVQSVMMDVTQQYHNQRRLEFQANHDSLTGLINRRAMSEVLIENYALSRRTSKPLGCIMLDIDDFKQINDRFGHLAGDEALRSIAFESLKVLRSEDYLSRWGGEEFLLLLPDTEQQQALDIANRVRQHIAEFAIQRGEQRFSATVSMGLAMLSEQDSSPEALISRADVALYLAKESGKNRVEVAPTVYQL